MNDTREPIAVIGTGYVGLVTAVGFAELGNEVWCVDIDAAKIEGLKAGRVPIYEPGLAESMAKSAERLHFTTDLAMALEHARLLFVAVGTPPTYSGDADLSAVYAVIAAIPPAENRAIVMKSTVPVGTGTAIRRELDRTGKGNFAYVSCPEFLKEGDALEDFRAPDRVVVGDTGTWAGDAVVELYAPLGAPLVRTDIASAEMIKLAANAFLATKISFINEIANVCEETGADVLEVARGMGSDRRIGEHFLRPGIGFGGSCLVGDESVLVRHGGRTTLMTLERLWDHLERRQDPVNGVIEPHDLKILSWVPGEPEPMFLSVLCVTRRDYDGVVVDVGTKLGRRLTTTADHPWLTSDGHGAYPERKLAVDLTPNDWVPIAVGMSEDWDATSTASLLTAVEAAEIDPEKLIVRPARAEIERIAALPVATRGGAAGQRSDVALASATVGATKNGAHALGLISLDEDFWRVVGLYVAGGCTISDGDRRRIRWSFGPAAEAHLADQVVAFWRRHDVHASTHVASSVGVVEVESGLLAAWWTDVLGLAADGSAQRLPDLIWDRPERDRMALLAGIFGGDGAWSPDARPVSATIEREVVGEELADGVMRLLASVGIVASRRVGRVANSTREAHWLAISGVEPGYRRADDAGIAWVRISQKSERQFRGPVYSLEVPYAHTIVSSGGLTVSNCFPKDVSALKQLAGNSGYHFQLLTAVIEVNELQKRRVIAKLQKHLGSLVGKRVTLLGLAFKPETDDMREASSLVLAARLQADGAHVRAYDPIAAESAQLMMPGVEFATSALEAVAGADAIVLVTEWDEFAHLDWEQVASATAGRLLIDGRNFVDRSTVTAAGFVYEGIGR